MRREKPADNKGVKGWVAKKVQQYAGSGTGSANRITLLRDSDGDGFAETRTTFLENLNSPFGMALVGQDFYVANTDAIMRFSYNQGETEITTTGTKLADLPGGALNHHWTKSLISDEGGKYLYAGIGSNSNVAENGTTRKKTARRFCRLSARAAKRGFLRQDCVTPWAWIGNL
jgi:glucose/arabinose dehydrogenase